MHSTVYAMGIQGTVATPARMLMLFIGTMRQAVTGQTARQASGQIGPETRT
jgi:hypothetical protein